MCVVSMVGDHYRDKLDDRPWFPQVQPFRPYPERPGDVTIPVVPIDRQEFELLKREVEDLKELLKRAKKYDDDNHEHECEVDEKMDLLRRVAELVGVKLDDVIGARTA